MSEAVSVLNVLLAIGGLGTFVVAIVLLVDLHTNKIFAQIISVWGLVGAFICSVVSVAMTLLYSEVFGFVPCGLCWLQRVFLYPQIFILAIALWYKDRLAARYGLVLSIPGLVVALYQHYLQMGWSEFVVCPNSGADCTKRFMFEFGFVTFPLLSVMLFIFLIALYLYILKVDRENEVVYKQNSVS